MFLVNTRSNRLDYFPNLLFCSLSELFLKDAHISHHFD